MMPLKEMTLLEEARLRYPSDSRFITPLQRAYVEGATRQRIKNKERYGTEIPKRDGV